MNKPKLMNWKRRVLFGSRMPHDLRRRVALAVNPRLRSSIEGQRSRIDPESNTGLVDVLRTGCLFVHIPKTAGISVATSIYGNLGGNHATITDYALALTKREFESFFKFAFVRNPFDRIYSAWRYLTAGGLTPADRDFGSYLNDRYDGFDGFVEGYLNKDTIYEYIHFVPQHEFLTLPYRQGVAVDFVGRFESLASDFANAARLAGQSWELKSLNRTAGSEKKKSAAGEPYRFNAGTARKIALLYERDFHTFKYSTDTPAAV